MRRVIGERVGRRWIFRSGTGPLGGELFHDLLALVLCIAVATVALMSFASATTELYRAWAASRWPVVSGTVVASVVEPANRFGRSSWYPQVTYSYAADGRTHISTRISQQDPIELRGRAEAEEYLKHYVPHGQVDVRFNPSQPSESVLEVRVGWSPFGALLLGVLASVAGLFILLVYESFRD
jgi:hypothetical protein